MAGTIIGMIFAIGKDIDTIGIIGGIICGIQIAVLLLSIIPTERALHKTFNKDGSRKNDTK